MTVSDGSDGKMPLVTFSYFKRRMKKKEEGEGVRIEILPSLPSLFLPSCGSAADGGNSRLRCDARSSMPHRRDIFQTPQGIFPSIADFIPEKVADKRVAR